MLSLKLMLDVHGADLRVLDDYLLPFIKGWMSMLNFLKFIVTDRWNTKRIVTVRRWTGARPFPN